MHVERLSASAWADAKEIGIVSHLHPAFLAGDVDADGQALAVGIVGFQRSVLTVFQMFLEEEAEGCVVERQEEIIVGVERVGVAGKGVHEELQLVISRL